MALLWKDNEVVFLPDRIRIKAPVLRFWASRANCLKVVGNIIEYNYKGTPYTLEIVNAGMKQETDHISITPVCGTCELIPRRAKTISAKTFDR